MVREFRITSWTHASLNSGEYFRSANEPFLPVNPKNYILGPTVRETPGSSLNAAIRQFITGWNDRAHPFVWTKTAEQVLKKANRQTTSNAGH